MFYEIANNPDLKNKPVVLNLHNIDTGTTVKGYINDIDAFTEKDKLTFGQKLYIPNKESLDINIDMFAVIAEPEDEYHPQSMTALINTLIMILVKENDQCIFKPHLVSLVFYLKIVFDLKFNKMLTKEETIIKKGFPVYIPEINDIYNYTIITADDGFIPNINIKNKKWSIHSTELLNGLTYKQFNYLINISKSLINSNKIDKIFDQIIEYQKTEKHSHMELGKSLQSYQPSDVYDLSQLKADFKDIWLYENEQIPINEIITAYGFSIEYRPYDSHPMFDLSLIHI